MDVIALGKASKALNDINDLDQNVIAPLAESHFPTVKARLDWLEGQAGKVKAVNSKQLDLSQGTFTNTEVAGGKVQLKSIGVNQYATSGTWESPIIDLGEGWLDTKLAEVVKKETSGYNNATPLMTSNTTPSPYVVAASSVYGNNYSWNAFSQGAAQWMSTYNNNEWISLDFGSGKSKIITKYAIKGNNGAVGSVSHSPKSFILQGSNDNTNWTNLDTRTNELNWTLGERREYIFPNTTTYRYYRLYVNLNNNGANYIIIDEIELHESVAGATLTLEIATSTDGLTFSSYTALDPTSPPDARYIKIKASLSATAGSTTPTNLDFNQSDAQNTFTLDANTVADGKLHLKTSYTNAMVNEGAAGTGNIYSTVLDKSLYKSIEKVTVS